MRSLSVDGGSRLLAWQRVREFAVPPTMIHTATVRRRAGDWAGACAAARVDIDLDPRTLPSPIRDDLRHLAPDLLRWHMPRIAPDGLLRPGLTVTLARYPSGVQLVARTAPAWAAAGQRIALDLWDGTYSGPHPHPYPSHRFRLDLHRHLWDVRRAGELGVRCGAPDRRPGDGARAAHRWEAEADLVRGAAGLPDAQVVVRLGAHERVMLPASSDPSTSGPSASGPSASEPGVPHSGLPGFGPGACGGPETPSLLLPDAATWVPPDLELLHAGLIEPSGLHPLVAASLAPGSVTDDQPQAEPSTRWVDCRNGARHRIGLVDGTLEALDHDPDELRRERILAGFGGPPLPCLREIDRVNRAPEGLPEIRCRLDHGDAAGAIAIVEALLGPDALLREGALRAELEHAAEQRITYGLYRSRLAGSGPLKEIPHSRRKGH